LHLGRIGGPVLSRRPLPYVVPLLVSEGAWGQGLAGRRRGALKALQGVMCAGTVHTRPPLDGRLTRWRHGPWSTIPQTRFLPDSRQAGQVIFTSDRGRCLPPPAAATGQLRSIPAHCEPEW